MCDRGFYSFGLFWEIWGVDIYVSHNVSVKSIADGYRKSGWLDPSSPFYFIPTKWWIEMKEITNICHHLLIFPFHPAGFGNSLTEWNWMWPGQLSCQLWAWAWRRQRVSTTSACQWYAVVCPEQCFLWYIVKCIKDNSEPGLGSLSLFESQPQLLNLQLLKYIWMVLKLQLLHVQSSAVISCI